MALTKEQWITLEKKASYLRHKTAEVCVWANGAHIGGAYSSADVLTALYYYVMNFSKDNYLDEDRDRLIISKGHAGVITAPNSRITNSRARIFFMEITPLLFGFGFSIAPACEMAVTVP